MRRLIKVLYSDKRSLFYHRNLTSLFCLFLLLSTIGKADDFSFKTYGLQEGLPPTYLYAVGQDHNHYLWMCTGEGLFRYNGKTMEPFFVEDGLAENSVTKTYLANNGLIYFGHLQGGITVFDGSVFKTIPTEGIVSSRVTGIKEDKFGRIWALTQNEGLLVVTDQKPGHIRSDLLKFKLGLALEIIDDLMFVATNEGLLQFKIGDDGHLVFMNVIHELEGTNIVSLKKSNTASGFWAATEDQGIYHLVVSTNAHAAKAYLILSPDQLLKASVSDLYEDTKGSLWVGTRLNGLLVFQNRATSYSLFRKFDLNNGFPGNSISSIFQDHEGSYWIGTFGNGLVQVYEKKFVKIQSVFPNHQAITSLVKTRQGRILAGTPKGILEIVFNLEKDHYELRELAIGKLKDWFINSLYEDGSENLWIGTKDYGLYKCDPSLKTAQPVQLRENEDHLNIRKVIGDKQGNIWASVAGSGFFKLNGQGQVLQNYSTSTGFIHNEVYDIYPDPDHGLWIATHSTGLSILNHKGVVDYYTKKGLIESRDINYITKDNAGQLWIASDGDGVFIYNGMKFSNYNSGGGLISNFCKFLISDLDNNIWVGHREGLSYLNRQSDDIFSFFSKGEIKEFDPIQNAVLKDEYGNFWIGTASGLIKINAPHQKFLKRNLAPIFVDFKIFFKRKDLRDYQPLQSKGSIPQNIILPYDENHITVDFISISYQKSQKILYQHKLEGFDADWSPPTEVSSVTYTNLDPGKYRLLVRAVPDFNYKDGDNIATLDFEIKWPIWKTWWFRLLFTLATVLFTFLWYRARINKIELQKHELEQQVKKRTLQVVKQKEEIEHKNIELQENTKKIERQRDKISEKNRELESARNRILETNNELIKINSTLEEIVNERTAQLKITLSDLMQSNKELDLFIYRASHDLNGPIARLLGLTMVAKIEGKEEISIRNFNRIEKEAVGMRRILEKLINIHMIFKSPFEFSEVNVNKMVCDVVDFLGNTLETAGINFKYNIPPDYKCRTDFNLLKIVLENLIENAVLYKREDATEVPYVTITVEDQEHHLHLTVEDNGLGIAPSIQSKVFDMFFRGNERSRGNGLGLYLVKKAVEKLKGHVGFDTEEGKFTKFTLLLPKLVEEETLMINPI